MTDNASVLKIAAVSLDIRPCSPEENIRQAEFLIYQLPEDVDVVVLPELFTTSLIDSKELLEKYAESNDGPTMTAMRRLSRERNFLISGSFAAVDNGSFYNRGFMILPDSRECFYDKRHLFGVSAEARVFTPGNAPIPVVEHKGWNVSMIICYDLRFPVWSRNVAHRYDLLLVPANWPQSRGYAWTHLLIARAIENQAVVVGANRGGSDEYGQYDGLTQIFDALGLPVGLSDNADAMIAGVNPSDIAAARRRLPAVFDADDFSLLL